MRWCVVGAAGLQQQALVCCRGERARTIRSAWQPMSFTGTLEGFVGIMNQAADRAVQQLAAAAKGEDAVNVANVLSALSMQVIASAAFG